MKYGIVLICIFFVINSFGQQLNPYQVDSLLNGTWKADSSNAVLKFDCHRKDTIVVYGILTQKKMDWYTSFKLSTICHHTGNCKVPNKGIYYLEEINYTNDPRMIPRINNSYKIISISNERLDLYTIQGSNRPECKSTTYSKIK